MTLTVDLATLFKVTAQCLATNSILIKSKDDQAKGIEIIVQNYRYISKRSAWTFTFLKTWFKVKCTPLPTSTLYVKHELDKAKGREDKDSDVLYDLDF